MSKTFVSTCLLPLSLLAFTVCSEAETRVTTVAVQDRSATASPLEISGTVKFRETASGATVRTAITEEISSRNISDKTILTLVVLVDTKPSYGGPQRSTRQYECFFAPDVIKSGDVHPLSQTAGAETAEPYDPATPPGQPRTEVTVVYVQFLDGSIFGHEAFGEEIQRLRRITWQHLRHLERTYVRAGEAAFVEEINEAVEPAEVDSFFENIRQTVRKHGAEIAIARIRSALKFAEERQAGFRGSKS